MKPVFHLLVFLLPFNLLAQQPTFQKIIDGPSVLFAADIYPTRDSGFIAAGYQWVADSTKPWTYGYLVKGNSTGNIQWSRSLNSPGIYFETVASVCQTSDGGYILNGTVQGPAMLVAKINDTGLLLWQRQIVAGSSATGTASTEAYGGYYFAGIGGNSTGSGGFLVKTNHMGSVLWSRLYTKQGEESSFQSITPTLDGGLLLTGRVGSHGGSADIWLVKTNADGDTLWTRRYDSNSGDDWAMSGITTSDGGYIVGGKCSVTSFNSSQVFLMKTDSLGSFLWSRNYPVGIHNNPGTVVNVNGGYAFSGSFRRTLAGMYDAYQIRTDDTGEVKWVNTYGGPSDDHFTSCRATISGGFIMAGYTGSFSLGNSGYKIYLVQTDSLGLTGCHRKDTFLSSVPIFMQRRPNSVTVADVGTSSLIVLTTHAYGHTVTLCTTATNISELPETAVVTIAPNPASGHFIVRSTIPLRSLVLTDITGNKALFCSVASQDRLLVDVSELPAGLYLYALETAGGRLIRGKVVVQH